MIDICTVVFEDEISILKVQAQSVANYCRNIGVRNIYVVLNCSDELASQIDPTWWGELQHHVLVIPRSAFSAAWVENGWVSQQLLKMLTASMSYNTWTMVLDAKTVFVRELMIKDLINQQGQLTVGQLPVYDVFKPAKDICDKFFNIDMQLQVGPGGVPFFFHNDTVRFMISECTFRSHESFPLWFQKHGMLTEFMLYSAYMQYRYGSLDQFITKENTLGRVVNVCHSEVQHIDSKLAEMVQPDTLTVSIHRNAWAELDEETRTKYRMRLLDANIMAGYDLK